MNQKHIQHLLSAAHKSIGPLTEALKISERGGVLCLMSHHGGVQEHEKIGIVPKKEISALSNSVKNKCASLVHHPKHISTTRDADEIEAGAIPLKNNYILGFAGFSSSDSRAYCIALARYYNLIDESQLEHIVEASGDSMERVKEIQLYTYDILVELVTQTA